MDQVSPALDWTASNRSKVRGTRFCSKTMSRTSRTCVQFFASDPDARHPTCAKSSHGVVDWALGVNCSMRVSVEMDQAGSSQVAFHSVLMPSPAGCEAVMRPSQPLAVAWPCPINSQSPWPRSWLLAFQANPTKATETSSRSPLLSQVNSMRWSDAAFGVNRAVVAVPSCSPWICQVECALKYVGSEKPASRESASICERLRSMGPMFQFEDR